MLELSARFPRLIRAMRLAGFSEGEAISAIDARRLKDDFAAAEAVCFVGGASKAIRHAMRVVRLYRGIVS